LRQKGADEEAAAVEAEEEDHRLVVEEAESLNEVEGEELLLAVLDVEATVVAPAVVQKS